MTIQWCSQALRQLLQSPEPHAWGFRRFCLRGFAAAPAAWRYSSRSFHLILAEQLGCVSASRLILVINICKPLAVAVTQQMLALLSSSTAQGGGQRRCATRPPVTWLSVTMPFCASCENIRITPAQLSARRDGHHAHCRLHRHWRSDRMHAGSRGNGSFAPFSINHGGGTRRAGIFRYDQFHCPKNAA